MTQSWRVLSLLFVFCFPSPPSDSLFLTFFMLFIPWLVSIADFVSAGSLILFLAFLFVLVLLLFFLFSSFFFFPRFSDVFSFCLCLFSSVPPCGFSCPVPFFVILLPSFLFSVAQTAQAAAEARTKELNHRFRTQSQQYDEVNTALLTANSFLAQLREKQKETEKVCEKQKQMITQLKQQLKQAEGNAHRTYHLFVFLCSGLLRSCSMFDFLSLCLFVCLKRIMSAIFVPSKMQNSLKPDSN